MEEAAVVLEEPVETVAAAGELDTAVPVAVDDEVAVEEGRMLVRVAPYRVLQVSLSMPSGQQSVLLRVPG